jgi:signal-transduction protein with cAMP-binding, CBS, and nucleotidyltransferase domain
LLRGVACFAPLPTATVENLAACARAERFAAGNTIDGGFHVIGDGAVELRMNGGPPERLGAGDSFGVDSLLRDSEPSTASAVTPVAALTIARADFVSRVTPPSRKRSPTS